MTTTAEETAVESPTLGDRVRVVSVHPSWSGSLSEGAEGTVTNGPSECCSGNHRWYVTLPDGRTGFASEVVKVTAPSDGTLRIGARVKVSDNPGHRGPGDGYVDPGFAGATGVIVKRGTGVLSGAWLVRRDGGPTEDGMETNCIHSDCLTVIEDEDAAYLRGADITEPEAPAPESTPKGEALALVADQRLTEALARAERAERELEAFRDKVRTRVIEEADLRGWCSEADEWLEELGLEGRSRDYIVYVAARVTIPVAFTRTAHNADAAVGQVEFSDVQSELDEHLSSVEFSFEDYEIEGVYED